MRLRCSFCDRLIGILWPRCPVCGTRQLAGYLYVLVIVLALIGLSYYFFFLGPASHYSQ